MHLHHPIPDHEIRLHQVENVVYWVSTFAKPEDAVVMVGDYNAEPDSLAYNHIIESGFTSSYKRVHSREPTRTFPTGLQAPFMDTDPACTLDFIFYKGEGVVPSSCERRGDKCKEGDDTVYGSDHYPLVTEFTI